MDSPLYSSSWYRVAALRPKLREHARIHRHQYRGRVWYYLQDLANQQFHRFSPAENEIIGLLNGDLSVDEIWHVAAEQLGDDAPTQDEMIRLLGQLHAADVLQAGVSPDAAEVLERHETRSRKERRGRFMNPLAIRIPLFDAESFLTKCLPAVKPLMGWGGLALWCLVVGWAGVVAASRGSELTEGIFDDTLALSNLVLVWLSFPFLKALHELGHGFVTRYYGGEVHDMGVMLLVFTPVPYVDASSSYAFPEKSRRMLVGAAGMIVEVFVAALALILWDRLEPSVARSLAFNVALIGGVSTLLFNANPLLRFDGYYILADWLEIPNLRGRANAFVRFLVERYAFGNQDADEPNETPSERMWLAGFAVTSFVYRMFVMAAILFYLLDQSLVLGGALVVLTLSMWVLGPLWKGFSYVFFDLRLGRARGRAQRVVIGAIVALVLVLGILPMPFRTVAEGVVWLPEQALVRVRTAGFVERVVSVPGARVERGAPLYELRNPELTRDIARTNARLRELHGRHRAARLTSESHAQIIEEEIRATEERVMDLQARRLDLLILSDSAGEFVSPQAERLVGRFVEQGELLGHVLDQGRVRVRTVVSDRDFDLVRDDTIGVDVRSVERIGRVVPAVVTRIAPAAERTLPSSALGLSGGGKIPVDPRDESGLTALRHVFLLDLELPASEKLTTAGGRVYVRFDHRARPLISQWGRSLRQLFLARFDV